MRIYAIGECASHRGIAYGLVAPLFEQAKVCANHLAQLGFSRYQGSVTSTKLKVTGIDLFSAGDFADAEDREEIVFRDATRGVYKRLTARENIAYFGTLHGLDAATIAERAPAGDLLQSAEAAEA